MIWILILLLLPVSVEAQRKAVNRPKMSEAKMKEIRRGPARQFVTDNMVSVSVHTDTSYVLYTTDDPLMMEGGRNVGPQRRIIMLIDFQNSGTRPFTKSYIENLWGQVNQWYQNISYGASTLTVEVVDWFRVPIDNTDCTTPYLQWAEDNARALGYNVDSYADRIYIMPSGGCRGLSGTTATPISSDGTIMTAIYLVGYGANFGVSLHEYGHSVGWNHSNRLQCASGVSLADNCTYVGYGDPYDVMGPSYSIGPVNAGHREFAGWLASQLVSGPGTFTLAPLDSWAGLRALRMPRIFTVGTVVSGVYYVEYRPPQGLYVRLMGDYTYFKNIPLEPIHGTLILDMTPEAYGDYWLPLGRSYYDDVLGMSLTFQGVTSEGAVVRVDYGPPVIPVTYNCVNYTCIDPGNGTGLYRTLVECQSACVPPPVDVTPPIILSIVPADGARLPSKGAVTLSASATDDRGVVRMSLDFDGSTIATSTGSDVSKNLPLSKVSSGSHTIKVWAWDAAGNVATRMATVTK